MTEAEPMVAKVGDYRRYWEEMPCYLSVHDREFRIVDGNRRFVEIWNLVFMQFSRDKEGVLHPLPAPSIDTGMGMERLTAVLQGVASNYRTDLFAPLIARTAELAAIDAADPALQVDLNVVADHVRALTFLIADGIMPANEGRGYVLRRLLRRAVKHGKALGLAGSFLHRLSSTVVEVMKPFYPELEPGREFIAKVIAMEEERFNRTLAVHQLQLDARPQGNQSRCRIVLSLLSSVHALSLCECTEREYTTVSVIIPTAGRSR